MGGLVSFAEEVFVCCVFSWSPLRFRLRGKIVKSSSSRVLLLLWLIFLLSCCLLYLSALNISRKSSSDILSSYGLTNIRLVEFCTWLNVESTASSDWSSPVATGRTQSPWPSGVTSTVMIISPPTWSMISSSVNNKGVRFLSRSTVSFRLVGEFERALRMMHGTFGCTNSCVDDTLKKWRPWEQQCRDDY